MLIVGGLLAVAGCAPPTVGATSPSFQWAAQLPDGSWEGNFLACTSGGGPVTVSNGAGGFDPQNPYVVEIFRGWSTAPENLVATGSISVFTDTVVSPAFQPGECFAVRVRHSSGSFAYVVTWCMYGCTVVPTPPSITGFGTAGEPFSDPALVPFAWTHLDPNDDPLTCRLDAESDGTWEVTVSDCPRSGARNLAVGEGSHVATLEVSDGTHPPVTATTAYVVAPGPSETYDVVIRQPSPLDPGVVVAAEAAAARFENVIARGVPDLLVQIPADYCGFGSAPVDEVVDDVLVDVVIAPLDGRGGTWGTAGGCVPGADGLPRFGLVIIDSADVPFLSDTMLEDLIAHELGHVIFHGADRWFSFVEGPLDRATFGGPRAVIEWALLGGEGGVPLQPNSPVHWDDATFGSELMTPGLNAPPNQLSALTVAALADVGYHVDLAAAEPYSLPNGSVQAPPIAIADR